jgi:hypothetical protein
LKGGLLSKNLLILLAGSLCFSIGALRLWFQPSC